MDSKKKTVLSDQAIEILRQWSKLDLILYKKADKLAKQKSLEAIRCLKAIK